jgi:hypothetical protein
LNLLTSIAPVHNNATAQTEAIQSWWKLGFKIYSFNPQVEIDQIKDKYPEVTFIVTEDLILQPSSGKKYVAINTFLDWAKLQPRGVYGIINSDIIIDCREEVMRQYIKRANTALVIGQRIDYTTTVEEGRHNGEVFRAGFDIFLIHSRFLSIFPKTNFCIGNTHWDYWIPYQAIKRQISVVQIGQKIIFHKIHTTQWHKRVWYDMGMHLREQEGLTGYPDTTRGIADMSERIKEIIMTKSTVV